MSLAEQIAKQSTKAKPKGSRKSAAFSALADALGISDDKRASAERAFALAVQMHLDEEDE